MPVPGKYAIPGSHGERIVKFICTFIPNDLNSLLPFEKDLIDLRVSPQLMVKDAQHIIEWVKQHSNEFHSNQ